MNTRFWKCGVVLCLCLVFTGLALADDVKSTVTSIEKNLWEAWKNKDTAAFKEHMTDNAVSVGPQGISTGKEQMISDMTAHPCEVRNFSFTDWQVHELSPETVLVTYKAKQDATCGGNKIPADIAASSVYVKKDGKWLAASHQETPLMEAGTAKAE
ncbi:MAG: nuclear transport factor 2 family protein [Acidobacteria bacterium]|nr:MAG: nuclear transport factor 2 family protein [Acidobacteriota bacterium]